LRARNRIVEHLQNFWEGHPRERNPFMNFFFLLLAPASWLYGCVLRLRRWAFRAGCLPSRRLSSKVLSVGGIRVGGTGKTPFVIWLAAALRDRGYRVAVLTRGYARRNTRDTQIVLHEELDRWDPLDCGDEPYLLARSLRGVPVVVDSDRYRGGSIAQRRFPVDLFLLDDGFQHRRLARDCDIVLLTGEEGEAGASCLPKGPLREPISALRDAHALVRMHGLPTDAAPGLHHPAADLQPRPEIPCFRAGLRRAGFFSLPEQKLVHPSSLEGAGVLAFCGIARPQSFWSVLESAGLGIVARRAFPDHHRYGEHDFQDLSRALSTAQWAVTTEKDAVKISRFPWPAGRVLFLRMEVLLEDEELFWTFLLERLVVQAEGGGGGGCG